MGRRMRIGLTAAAGVAVVAATVVAGGRVAFERRVARDVDELFAASREREPSIVTEADLAGLPEPVQRWLRASAVVGKERPVTVRLKQEGRFRLGADRAWMPFEAEEYYTIDPPGFVWSVEMRMAPLLSIRGRDRYLRGKGEIGMRLLSLIPVADASGSGLDQGALLRYLNETMWFPAAALSLAIAWQPIDARSARATIRDQGLTVDATFIFDEAGRPTDMVAERYRLDADRMNTWSTPIHAYGEFGGIKVPVAGEGVWKSESGDFAYIELRITEIEYNRFETFSKT